MFGKAKLIQSHHSQLYSQLFEHLHSENTVKTDIYYKDEKVHDYLLYKSAYQNIVKTTFHKIFRDVLLFLFLMMKRWR